MTAGGDERCADTLIVGTTVWLPDDPRERFVSDPDLIGCNRLFCGSCRSWVRHLDNVRFRDSAGEPPSSDVASLYFDPHPENYAGFSWGRLSFRVYLCRCECTEVVGVKSTCMSDTVDCWRCAGHPPPSAPEAVVPPQPKNDAGVRAMLRSAASEGWHFALRWRPPFVFRSVWPVVTGFLVDPDPVLRARSLELVDAWKYGDAATLYRLLDIAENHTSLYEAPALRAQLIAILSRKAIELPTYRSTIAEALACLRG